MKTDIDIDFGDRTEVLKLIKHIPATQVVNGELRKHNSGIYVHDIPKNPITNLAAIDYESAEKRGYVKLDFLNMSIYQLIRNQDHYKQLLENEPNWSKLWLDIEWSKQIVHIGNHTHLLVSMKPDNIIQMAAFISIIRPGKAHLQNQSWDQVLQKVWDGDTSKGYCFKKAHAISYAALVALHMNLLM